MEACPAPTPAVYIPDLQVARLVATCTVAAPNIPTGGANVGGAPGEFYSALDAGVFRFRTLAAGAGAAVVTAGDVVTVSATGGGGGLEGAANVGAGGGEVFAGTAGATAEFRRIGAGIGISVETDGSRVVITALPAIGPGAAAAAGGAAFGQEAAAGADGAFAAGSYAAASEISSTAVGRDTVASAQGAAAFAEAAAATGLGALAVGNTARATAIASVALGPLSSAAGPCAVAAGSRAASGADSSVAIGADAAVPIGANRGAALGAGARATAEYALAGGAAALASAVDAVALGNSAQASASGATALGAGAEARVADTTSIAGGIIVPRTGGRGLGDAARFWTGAVVVIGTDVIDLGVEATHDLGIPAGAAFIPTALVVRSLGAPAAAPAEVWLGNEADAGAYLAAFPLDGAGRRVAVLASAAPAGVLRARVAAAAPGPARCRFYWEGLLVEDEAPAPP